MLIALITLMIGLFFSVIAGSRNVFIAIILTRSIADPIFELTKGGGGMGVGGGVNLLVIALALKTFLKSPHVALPSAAVIWFPFLIAILPCAMLAPSGGGDGLRWYLSIVSYFCVFVLPYYYIKSQEDFHKFLLVVLGASLLPVLLAPVLPGMEIEGQMRAMSTFTHPNILSFFLVATLFVCLLLIQELPPTAKILRIAITLYIPLVLLVIITTKTRSAWMAAGLLLVVYALIYDRRYILYMALGAVAAAATPGVLERIQDLGQGNVAEDYAALNSYAWRLTLWESALEWADDGRWLGYGATSFRMYMPWFFPLPLPDEQGLDAHSSYIQLIFEGGYVGISGFLWLLGSLCMAVYIYRNRQNYNWILSAAAIAGYALVSSSDNVMQYLAYNWYFFFLLGSVCAYGALLKRGLERPRRTYESEALSPA